MHNNMIKNIKLAIDTGGRGTYELTDQIQQHIRDSRLETGICHVFVHHTSASLMLCENADPSVRRDLEAFMQRMAPDGDPGYEHDDEGPDDMPAHIRSVLTQPGIALPVVAGRADLGTWQGVYLWEHRTRPHRRHVTLSLQGETGS